MPTDIQLVDREAIELLVVDDEVIDLLKVGNEDSIRSAIANGGTCERFIYPAASGCSESWGHRLELVYDWFGKAEQSGRLTGVKSALWMCEIARQRDYLEMALGMSQGCHPQTAEAMRRLYGTPTSEELWQALGEIHLSAREAHENTENTELVRDAAGNLLRHFDRLQGVPDLLPEPLPSAELVAKVADWYRPIMEPFWEQAKSLDLPDDCAASDIARLFELVLAGTGIDTVITTEVTAVTFQPSRSRIAIPPDRSMTRLKLTKTLLLHEWAHIARHLNGLESGLALAAYGLPGYLTFEEGVATGLTSAVGKKDPAKAVTSYARPEAMVAIGLAAGLHEGSGIWHLEELYGFFYDHYRLEKLAAQKGDPDMAKVNASADHQAMTRVIRTLRGTVGPDRQHFNGACYCPRDLSYRRGNLGFWRWVERHPNDLDLLLRAKADLTNPLHLEFVNSIGL